MSTPESTPTHLPWATLWKSRPEPYAGVDFIPLVGFGLCSQDCHGQKYSCRFKPHRQDLHSVTPKTLDIGGVTSFTWSLTKWLHSSAQKKTKYKVWYTAHPSQTTSLPSICRHQRGSERDLKSELFKTPAVRNSNDRERRRLHLDWPSRYLQNQHSILPLSHLQSHAAP